MRANQKPLLAVIGLLGLYALLAWSAAANKSATYDEPLHIASSLAQKQLGDYRVDAEDPALFKRWLSILQPEWSLATESVFFRQAGREPSAQWAWSVLTLFDREAEQAMAMIDRGRLAMLIAAVVLGAVIAAWAWQVGGPAAGVIAACLFVLDPTFLGHGPLAKNDVAAALGFALAAWALWNVGQHVTAPGVVGLALAVAMAVTVKFSGGLLAVIVPLALGVRAIMSRPWPVAWGTIPFSSRADSLSTAASSGGARRSSDAASGSKQGPAAAFKTSDGAFVGPAVPDGKCPAQPDLQDFGSSDVQRREHGPEARGTGEPCGSSLLRRVILAVAICGFVAVVAFTGIWACYGFRYNVSPDPAYALNVSEQAGPSSVLAAIDRAHVLPQSYTFGLAYTLKSAERRTAFLFGQTNDTGWWYYFPVAMAVKTPLATIAMVLVAIALLVPKKSRSRLREHSWLGICLLLPAILYTLFAMRSSLNLGVRHMLPVYPLAFVAIAIVLARHRRIAGGLLIVLAIESMTAFPDYIAYFNATAGGSRGGARVLSDSNLDWGQDLKSLAAWQADHPGTRLYLSYFGTADPHAYGVDYVNAGSGYAFNPQSQMPTSPGVLAVSATHLQGMYVNPQLHAFYADLRKRSPREVLGGTIYLYDWPGVTGAAATDIIPPR